MNTIFEEILQFVFIAILMLVASLSSFYFMAPASWFEVIEKPVLLACKTNNSTNKKLISFTPNFGKIIYDGSQVNGKVSSGIIKFSFQNVNNNICDWTISRIDGLGQTSCKNNKNKYHFNDLHCEIHQDTKF